MKKANRPIEKPELPPAKSAEERENQLIALATDRAEQQLRDGTASAQVICHYLRMGSTRERLEKEIMRKNKILIEEKTESLRNAKRTEEIYARALDAMRRYSGVREDTDPYEELY